MGGVVPVCARVTSYTVQDVDGRAQLTSVTVQRDGGTAIFDAAKLIPVRLTHFRASAPNNLVLPPGEPMPRGHERAQLLNTTLNAGVINPGGQDAPLTASPVLSGNGATPGMAVMFAEPVVNLPGDDVVLFEIQREVASPLGGDPVRVCPLLFAGGSKSLTLEQFDLPFDHPKAQFVVFDGCQAPSPPGSLRELERATYARSFSHDDFKVLAVGIDLSDLGFAEGDAVDGLFLQNAKQSGAAVDPVCLVGLPRPEPPNVLAKEPEPVVPPPPRVLERALEGPLAEVEEIVFAVRQPGTDHWYANFGYYSAPVAEYPPQRAPGAVKLPPIFKGGGRLCVLDLRTKQVRTLLDDPDCSVRDPQVHYDGRRILFSYRKPGSPYFHLHEINADGTGLRQLTDGPYNDIEPTYLPDGSLMFCSDRCNRFVNCWRTPVATLHRCDADGGNLRIVSTNVEHDNTPWVLPDGRVLNMRWEYVDRNQLEYHHLWTVNPDGTGQMVYFGNMHGGIAMLDAKPIPGTG